MSLLALSSLACSGTNTPSPRPPSDIELQQQVADLQARLLAAEKRAIVGEVDSARLRRRVHDLEEQLAAAQRRGSPSSATESNTTESRAAIPHTQTSAPSSQGGSASPPSDAGRTTPFPAPSPREAEPPLQAPDAALPTDAGIEEEDLEDSIPVESFPEPSPETAAPSSTETPSADAPETTAVPSGASGTLQPPDDTTFAAYDAAYVLFHEKRYREAEGQFIAFVSRYPNSELTDNAQFWIGESRYARQDYQGALEAFSATVADYPGGNKVPDAMLKAGKSLEALGRLDQARQTYLEIQRRFPETAVALAAQDQLAGLD